MLFRSTAGDLEGAKDLCRNTRGPVASICYQGLMHKILVCENGAYGARMAQLAKQAGKNVVVYHEEYSHVPDAKRVKEYLDADPSITHVGMIHSETTSGILNDIEAVGKVVKEAGKTFIVDGMSSFAGVDIDVKAIGIDFIISSANKCIQGP